MCFSRVGKARRKAVSTAGLRATSGCCRSNVCIVCVNVRTSTEIDLTGFRPRTKGHLSAGLTWYGGGTLLWVCATPGCVGVCDTCSYSPQRLVGCQETPPSGAHPSSATTSPPRGRPASSATASPTRSRPASRGHVQGRVAQRGADRVGAGEGAAVKVRAHPPRLRSGPTARHSRTAQSCRSSQGPTERA